MVGKNSKLNVKNLPFYNNRTHIKRQKLISSTQGPLM